MWRVGVGKVHLRIDGEEPVLQTRKLKFRDARTTELI